MTQAEMILGYLQSGRALTPLVALDRFGCFRLAARIKNLRDQGRDIRTTHVPVGRKKIASYRLST